ILGSYMVQDPSSEFIDSNRLAAEVNFDADAKLDACQERIEYQFRDVGLLKAALTHASGADHPRASNERLEFLGDAILGAIVCEMLFHQYPEHQEGNLTKIKSVVVSRQSCAKISHSLGLREFLILGKGMATTHEVPSSVLADVFESLLAAIYLDGGNGAAWGFIERYLGPEIEAAASSALGGNYKSLLQQRVQRDFGSTPVYRLLEEQGPDHVKCFKVSAVVDGQPFEPAWGRTKKEAQQQAACHALSELDRREKRSTGK
ncbi:MAG: ribonuclease III, partial [Pirellulaceae bacterium]